MEGIVDLNFNVDELLEELIRNSNEYDLKNIIDKNRSISSIEIMDDSDDEGLGYYFYCL